MCVRPVGMMLDEAAMCTLRAKILCQDRAQLLLANGLVAGGCCFLEQELDVGSSNLAIRRLTELELQIEQPGR
jgi:hypothetical protein